MVFNLSRFRNQLQRTIRCFLNAFCALIYDNINLFTCSYAEIVLWFNGNRTQQMLLVVATSYVEDSSLKTYFLIAAAPMDEKNEFN